MPSTTDATSHTLAALITPNSSQASDFTTGPFAKPVSYTHLTLPTKA